MNEMNEIFLTPPILIYPIWFACTFNIVTKNYKPKYSNSYI